MASGEKRRAIQAKMLRPKASELLDERAMVNGRGASPQTARCNTTIRNWERRKKQNAMRSPQACSFARRRGWGGYLVVVEREKVEDGWLEKPYYVQSCLQKVEVSRLQQKGQIAPAPVTSLQLPHVTGILFPGAKALYGACTV